MFQRCSLGPVKRPRIHSQGQLAAQYASLSTGRSESFASRLFLGALTMAILRLALPNFSVAVGSKGLVRPGMLSSLSVMLAFLDM